MPFTEVSRWSWTAEAVIGLSGVEILMTRREVVVGVIPKRRKDSEILGLYLERKDREYRFQETKRSRQPNNGVGTDFKADKIREIEERQE